MSSQLVSAAPAVIEVPRIKREPLAVEWLDFIFTSLNVKYGDAFLQSYKTVKIPILRADWAKELGEFAGREHVFDHALSNLPEKPCNVLQFKALCKQAAYLPIGTGLSLPEPNPVSRKGCAQFKRWRDQNQVCGDGDYLTRARELMSRELAGERISPVQADFWRIALAKELHHQTGINVRNRFDIGELKLALDGYRSTIRQCADQSMEGPND
jgi:hypothetical protein